MPAMHIIVKGKVQGVFYRATAKKIADDLGAKGWLKNTKDGWVELMITGNEELIEKMLAWCQHGPENATVTEVIVHPAKEQSFSSFSILR